MLERHVSDLDAIHLADLARLPFRSTVEECLTSGLSMYLYQQNLVQ
jgi:hypothetical protein